jgi:hypothetical protein
MAFNYSPRITTDGLVLYLDAANTRSYPGVGTTWTDLSRGENTGTLVNGPTFDAGNGGSIVFDGSNDYVNCGGFLNITNNITVQCWVKTSTNTQTTFIGKFNNLTNRRSYYIGTSTSGTNIQVILSQNGTSFNRYLGDIINDNTWKNVVFTFSSGDISIYINGISDTITKIGTEVITTLHNSNANLLIGAIAEGTSNFINGSIAQTSIYNRALSSSEVLQNFNATRARFGI